MYMCTQTAISCEAFLLQSFGKVTVLWQVKIFMCYCTVFVFNYKFTAISKYKPSGAYIRRGILTEESFRITSLGGLYLERFMHGGIFPETSVL